MAYVLAPSDPGCLVGATIAGGKLLSLTGVFLGFVREIPTSAHSALIEISCGEGEEEGETASAKRDDRVGCSIDVEQGEVEWTLTGDSIGEQTKRLTGEQGFTWGGTAVESVQVEAKLKIEIAPNVTKEVEAPDGHAEGHTGTYSR